MGDAAAATSSAILFIFSWSHSSCWSVVYPLGLHASFKFNVFRLHMVSFPREALLKDTPRSINGAQVLGDISMVGLAIDKRSSAP